MRGKIALFIAGLGITLAAVAYFFLAAPIGPPAAPVRAVAQLLGLQAAIDVPAAGPYSEPRMLGAPLIFIFGTMLVFLSAVVYELLPDRREPQQTA